MKNKKLASFTLNNETVEMLDYFATARSINRSALVDKLIRDEFRRYAVSLTEEHLFDKENEIPENILRIIKKYVVITSEWREKAEYKK